MSQEKSSIGNQTLFEARNNRLTYDCFLNKKKKNLSC